MGCGARQVLRAYPRHGYWPFLTALEPPAVSSQAPDGSAAAQLSVRRLHEERLAAIMSRLSAPVASPATGRQAATSPSKRQKQQATAAAASAGSLQLATMSPDWQQATQVRALILKLATPFEKDITSRRIQLSDARFGGGIKELRLGLALVIPTQAALQSCGLAVSEGGSSGPLRCNCRVGSGTVA